MNPIFGTYREGQIVPDSPVDWPEGARVAIVPAALGRGLAESDWPDNNEARANLLARIDALEPLELTTEDEAEIGAAREAVRSASIQAVRRRMGLTR